MSIEPLMTEKLYLYRPDAFQTLYILLNSTSTPATPALVKGYTYLSLVLNH